MKEIYILQAKDLFGELLFSTSRSSGPGGQNVNKVNSKVTLKFDIVKSQILDDVQKATLMRKLATRLTKDGVVVLTAQEARSQLQNRDEVLAKLDKLLVQVFTPVKKRKPTKPGKASRQKRLQQKKQHSEKKQWRQKP